MDYDHNAYKQAETAEAMAGIRAVALLGSLLAMHQVPEQHRARAERIVDEAHAAIVAQRAAFNMPPEAA